MNKRHIKVINIRFDFSLDEWADIKARFGTEANVRQSLYEGAIGELDCLMGFEANGSEIKEHHEEEQ